MNLPKEKQLRQFQKVVIRAWSRSLYLFSYLFGKLSGVASRIMLPIGVVGMLSSSCDCVGLGARKLSSTPDKTATPMVPHPKIHN